MDTKRLTLGAVAIALVAVGVFLIRSPEPTRSPVEQEPLVAAQPSTPATVTGPSPAKVDSSTAVTASADASSAPVATEPVPSPNLEMAPSPFDSADSKELQYAVQLVIGPETGPEQWHNAARVFQRCVDANPTNHLCRRGVFAAWERIDSDGGPATALTTGMEVEKLRPPPRKDGLIIPSRERYQ